MAENGTSPRLTDVEQHALLAVWRLGQSAYGAEVRDELARRTGRRLSISAVYVTLVRLEKRGLLRSYRSEPQSVPGGKARRHFEIVAAGVSELKASRAQLERLWEGLDETPEWRSG